MNYEGNKEIVLYILISMSWEESPKGQNNSNVNIHQYVSRSSDFLPYLQDLSLPQNSMGALKAKVATCYRGNIRDIVS